MNQITSENQALPDTSTLLPSIMSTLAPILLLSTILTIVLAVAYIFSVIRRYKVEKAILAMQKDIHELNERDRARSAAPEAPAVPVESERIIAADTPLTPPEQS